MPSTQRWIDHLAKRKEKRTTRAQSKYAPIWNFLEGLFIQPLKVFLAMGCILYPEDDEWKVKHGEIKVS